MVHSVKGMSAEDRRKITLKFSLLQRIKMSTPDMPKERILELNRLLNRIPKMEA